MTKPLILRSASRCIYENLALEDFIFRNLAEGEEALLLWRNRDCVVLGRYQNPYTECRPEELRRRSVGLARRQSGGGAVWHDEGNLCFTFFGGGRGFSRRDNIELTAEALRRLGVPAEINRRLDILAEGCKISGSAFRESRGFSFHHGTILIQADLEKLAACLGGGLPAGPASSGGRGIPSVPSPVRNAGPYMRTDRPMEAAETALAEAFIRRRSLPENGPEVNGPEIETIDPQTIGEASFSKYLEHIQSRDWIYGNFRPPA